MKSFKLNSKTILMIGGMVVLFVVLFSLIAPSIEGFQVGTPVRREDASRGPPSRGPSQNLSTSQPTPSFSEDKYDVYPGYDGFLEIVPDDLVRDAMNKTHFFIKYKQNKNWFKGKGIIKENKDPSDANDLSEHCASICDTIGINNCRGFTMDVGPSERGKTRSNKIIVPTTGCRLMRDSRPKQDIISKFKKNDSKQVRLSQKDF